METSSSFAELLSQYVTRSAYTPGQLSRLTGLPKGTIVNWLEGRVRKPRVRQDLLRMAEALHLDAAETAAMLRAAGHPSPTPSEQGNGARPAEPEANGAAHHAPFQVIADLPYFVGRESALHSLESQLRNGLTVMIHSLHGMGGVGKTSLAAHLAYRLRDHFSDGVLWARLDLSDPMAVLSTFARAYGHDVTHLTDLDSRSRVVRGLLADKRALIVLDNVEDSDSVRPLLPPTGGCAVLLTTRRQDLAIAMGAHRTVLGPFDPAEGEALMLFEKLLGAERVQQEREALVELAGRLGHLPLAVAIAAGRLAYEPDWTAADFVARLRESQGLRALDYGDQSVYDTFALSFDRLSEPVQEFFMLLGLFRGSSFSVEAASAMMEVSEGEAHDWLRHLYRLSLVQGSHERRYRLHPLLFSYARQLLEASTQRAAWEERLVEYYLRFVREHREEDPPLREEQDNIVGAIEVAQERGMLPSLRGLLGSFMPYLEREGQPTLELRLLDGTVEVSRSLRQGDTLEWALAHTGRVCINQREYERARAACLEGLALVRARGDDVQTLHFLPGLAMAEHIAGNQAAAEAYLEEALPIAQREEDEKALASILGVLGEVALDRGDFARSEQLLTESMELYRASGMEVMVQVQLHNLGVTAAYRGDDKRAEALLLESLGYTSMFSLRSLTMEALGEVYTRSGQYDLAASYLTQAMDHATRHEQRWVVLAILEGWGEWYLAQSRYDEARDSFSEALSIAREMALTGQEGEALFGLGRIAHALGDLTTARNYCRQSMKRYDSIQHYRAADVREFLRTEIEQQLNRS